MPKRDNIVVGLDVGTTKICAVVAERVKGGELRILGFGSAPSKGLRKGVVVNIESTVDSIGRAVDEAELSSGVEVGSVFVGIAGGHIQSCNSRGVVPITAPNNEITRADVDKAISAAKAIAVSIDREIIHAIPQQFHVDGEGGIADPVGLHGMRLEADVHIVTGAVMSAQNIVKCVNTAGIQVEDIVLQPLASSMATLSDIDKQVGAILVDIGGGTTDFIVFSDGSVRHSDVLYLAGNDVTRDIHKVLCIPESKAEELKVRYGYAMASMARTHETFPRPATMHRAAGEEPLRTLCEIIEFRMREIFSITRDRIQGNGCGDLVGSGVVLTGGMALLRGSRDLARDVFNGIPARIGRPQGVVGAIETLASPIYATAIGLAKYGAEFRSHGEETRFNRRNIFKSVFRKMQEWVRGRSRSG
ncbi:MAG: cell division protein FtsA [bacterium]|jgi:cell division protein FtsA|nr:cell division protein FtsA [bacterium]